MQSITCRSVRSASSAFKTFLFVPGCDQAKPKRGSKTDRVLSRSGRGKPYGVCCRKRGWAASRGDKGRTLRLLGVFPHLPDGVDSGNPPSFWPSGLRLVSALFSALPPGSRAPPGRTADGGCSNRRTGYWYPAHRRPGLSRNLPTRDEEFCTHPALIGCKKRPSIDVALAALAR